MYSTWAAKQRSKILIIFGSIGFVVFAIYVTISLYEPPSCMDNKLNQDEVGVDCGGVCKLMCTSQVSPLRTVWSRSYQVSDSLWNAFAYVENPNPRGYVEEARYRFTIYDRTNTVLAEQEGTTFITHEVILPVFAKRIYVGEGIPYRTVFEWVEPLMWYRVDDVYTVQLEEQNLSNMYTKPELTATLVNKDPFLLRDVEVTAIVYDVNKNAIAVSKTLVDELSPRGKRQVVFTWPSAFTVQPERWELIARVPPFQDL